MINALKNVDEKKSWLFASTLLNASLAAAKLGWGWFMGSTLVMADGIHSISDVFGALLIFLALFFAAHKSERFPYGLHKLEDMAAFFGGFGILFAGYEIVHSVFFESGIQTPTNILSTVLFILVLITIQFIFYFFELKAAKRLNSPGVKADAINWLGDIGAGFIVVVGLIAHQYHIAYAQEIAVVIIVFMIFEGAYDVLKEATLSLLDAADIELTKKIKSIILSYSDITEIKRIMVRKSGSVYFADIEVNIDETMMKKAHTTIDKIVNQLHNEIEELEAVTIHYEPQHLPYKTIIELLDENKNISEDFKHAVWLKIIKKTDEEVLSEQIIKSPVASDGKAKAFKLVAWMIRNNVDEVVVNKKDIDENILALFETLDITLSTN
ncbi:cation diffusion facilitator family transporter [Sulfurimonas autotrophica]|uniref:Cation diffusion facilitator family transporter n=1 Tax=Sulfurimonas autotrophica (strain ATCC BAA-671 / DSM 16294 / JCM 11897 / OK10) TaxID=563040 RepID=E0UP76_SULAO|nr:cation diffusion facilitator family transporter [Sulfurimonas autotrophica]ADN08540.1 cation diffusion facilitator family transporter [Sulfurimonas autotrophica DSM 16294]